MSSKLDKPLDDIVSAKRQSARNRRSSQRRSTGPKVAAPVGGIQKSSKPARGSAAKPVPAKAAAAHGESKVIVSNLPKDVSEQQIKEYFIQAVGPIKRIDLVYGPNSVSRGIANVTFHKADGASKAFQKLNGLLVDNRPIKIEIVVGAAQADKVMPPVKSLADRATQPKAQPKSAASGKGATGGVGKAGNAKAANKKRRGRSARPAKKTAEELDSEMTDYFKNNPDGAAAGAGSGAAPAGGAGDAPMEDEIM